jgi:hypothetical protein
MLSLWDLPWVDLALGTNFLVLHGICSKMVLFVAGCYEIIIIMNRKCK